MSVPSDNIRDDIFAEHDDASSSSQDESTDQPATSNAGSSFSDPDTAEGGADAVPDTPDDVVENNIADAEKGDYSRTGRDVVEDGDSRPPGPRGPLVG